MKKLMLASALFTSIISASIAGVTMTTPSQSSSPEIRIDSNDGKASSGDFVGTITAIETIRDSITVVSGEGQVRMFGVTPDQKAKFAVGQKVIVSFIDQYTWPLPTKNVSGSDH